MTESMTNVWKIDSDTVNRIQKNMKRKPRKNWQKQTKKKSCETELFKCFAIMLIECIWIGLSKSDSLRLFSFYFFLLNETFTLRFYRYSILIRINYTYLNLDFHKIFATKFSLFNFDIFIKLKYSIIYFSCYVYLYAFASFSLSSSVLSFCFFNSIYFLFIELNVVYGMCMWYVLYRMYDKLRHFDGMIFLFFTTLKYILFICIFLLCQNIKQIEWRL